jgi:hypothetical protein
MVDSALPFGVNGCSPSPARKGQPHPSKPTICPVKSIISSVPIPDDGTVNLGTRPAANGRSGLESSRNRAGYQISDFDRVWLIDP